MPVLAEKPAARVGASTWSARVGPQVWLPLVLLFGALGYPFFLLVTSAFNVGDPQALPPVKYGFDNFFGLLDHLDWIGNSLILRAGGPPWASLLASFWHGSSIARTCPGGDCSKS